MRKTQLDPIAQWERKIEAMLKGIRADQDRAAAAVPELEASHRALRRRVDLLIATQPWAKAATASLH